jgi:hypothetical protein
MKIIHIEAENGIKNKVPKDIPLPCQSLSLRQEGFEPRKKRAAGNTALERVFNKGEREILDQLISRMFYAAGLPFNLARNPYYVKAYIFLDIIVNNGYKGTKVDFLLIWMLRSRSKGTNV